MKDFKVLTKLHFKARHRTVFLSEQGFNNTWTSGQTIPANWALISKQKMSQEQKPNQRTVWLNQIYKPGRISLPISARSLTRLAGISIPLVGSQKDFCKQRLGCTDILNDRVLTLRSVTTYVKKRGKHKMIRPLLDLKREKITMVCKDFKMPVYPDQSNKSVEYSRNRIRKQIIPSLQSFINPQIENSLFKLAELLNKEQFFLYSLLRNTSANVPL